MKRKEDREKLVQQFKEIPIQAGIFQIRNTLNGKLFIDSTLNMKSLNGQNTTLRLGTHNNKALQKEWNEYGEQAFVMEVLEVLKPSDNPFVVLKDELKKLKAIWIEKLQPFGERGYHSVK
jgi:hypothetical protein